MFRVIITYRGHPSVLKKLMKSAVLGGLSVAARHWHKKYAPLHFKLFAPAKYHYKKRSPKYMERHAGNLVHEGTSEEFLTRFMWIKRIQRGHQQVVECSFSAPRYFFIRKKTDPDKFAEFSRMLPPEMLDCAKVADGVVEMRLKQAARVVTRRRIG